MKQQNLTQGPITKGILLFALPLMFGNLLQQMYNIADTWVVGRFLGADALAAVGSAYTLMTFLTSILLGLCMGSGAAVSMQYGSGEADRMRQSVFQSFVLIACIALVLNLLVYLGLDGILWVLQVPGELRGLMKDYLLIIFLGITATFLYNYFANLLRAIGNSVVPLVFLAVSAVLNVALDLVCVLALGWGVRGQRPPPSFSQYVSGIGIGVYTLLREPQLCPAGRPPVGPAESGRDPEPLGHDQRPAVHHEFRHPDGAGAGQQLRHRHHGGFCGGGEDRLLCLHAGAGLRQRLLHLCGPELRCRAVRPHPEGHPQRRADQRRLLRPHQPSGLHLCPAPDGHLH